MACGRIKTKTAVIKTKQYGISRRDLLAREESACLAVMEDMKRWF